MNTRKISLPPGKGTSLIRLRGYAPVTIEEYRAQQREKAVASYQEGMSSEARVIDASGQMFTPSPRRENDR